MPRTFDFTKTVRDKLANEAGNLCSMPECQRPTSGGSFGNPIGEAAHIYASSSDGPRGSIHLLPEFLSSRENGIWVCRNCHGLIDNPQLLHKYPPDTLLKIKNSAIERATERVINPKDTRSIDESEYLNAMGFYNQALRGMHGLNDGIAPSYSPGTFGFAGGAPHMDQELCAIIHDLANPRNLPAYRHRRLNELTQEITLLFRDANSRIITGNDIVKGEGTQYVDERRGIIRGISTKLAEYSEIINSRAT